MRIFPTTPPSPHHSRAGKLSFQGGVGPLTLSTVEGSSGGEAPDCQSVTRLPNPTHVSLNPYSPKFSNIFVIEYPRFRA